MPRNKDLKHLVRTRMAKTGESYTTARAHVTRQPRSRSAPDYAALAGKRDEVLVARTGRNWQQWVRLLDAADATKLTHGDIARLLNTKYHVDGWWAQTVTVGYERIKGLRAHGQRLDGTYEASKSRTFNVPVATLYAAWSDARRRRKWLAAEVRVRTASPSKSMRLGWSDGTIVAVWFSAKGAGKSTVALAHTKLRSREAAQELKQFWGEQLDALAELLRGSPRVM